MGWAARLRKRSVTLRKSLWNGRGVFTQQQPLSDLAFASGGAFVVKLGVSADPHASWDTAQICR